MRDRELHYLTTQATKYPDRRHALYAIALLGELGYIEPREREILNRAVDRINKQCDAMDIVAVKVDGRKRKRPDDED